MPIWALKINPRLPSALRLKADVLLLAGEVDVARKLLLKAKEVNPRDETILARIAACARMENRPNDVKAVIAEVEKFNPKPGVFYEELATASRTTKSTATPKSISASRSCEPSRKQTSRQLPAGARAGLACFTCDSARKRKPGFCLEKSFKEDRFNVRVANSIKVLRHLENYETIHTKHYDFRFDPKHDKLLAQFMAEYLEETHAKLAKDFQFEPKDRVLVELFNSHEMFSGRTVAFPIFTRSAPARARCSRWRRPRARESCVRSIGAAWFAMSWCTSSISRRPIFWCRIG